jgi:hypothetical protein
MEQSADAFPCGFDRAFSGFSQEELEFGEDLFDRVEVRAVGRQEQLLGPCRPDCLAHSLAFVAAEIVHDDDVTGC